MVDTNPTANTTTSTSTPVPNTQHLEDLGMHTSDHPQDESTVTAGPTTAAQPPSSTPSNTSEGVPTNDAPSMPQRPRESPVDPQVVALRAMFPDYDDLILQSVLESVGGNQDRAIDALLGMSDPDYRSEQPPLAPPPMSQTELDEQLARRLMIEEQDAQQAAWQARETQRAQRQPRPQWSQQNSTQGQNTTVSGGDDTMGEIQQQFNKIAETGKKTFGNIFSKVKAKIQEFDQPRTGQGSTPSNQPAWGSGAYDPYENQQQPYLARPSPHQSPPPPPQPAYYDPNAYDQRSTSPSLPAPISSAPPVASGFQGYDATPDASARLAHAPSPIAAPVPSTATEGTVGTLSAAEVPRPPQTGSGMGQAGAPIDGGKLGLLPKRPVSLLRSQSPPAAGGTGPSSIQRSTSEDDSDGLEYTENPFEERKK